MPWTLTFVRLACDDFHKNCVTLLSAILLLVVPSVRRK